MERWTVILAVVVVCMAAGYGVGLRDAEAAITPPACPKFACKNAHAYWSAGAPANTVYAYYKANGNIEVQGFLDIFTPESDRKQPARGTGVTLKKKVHTTCIPHCGKVNNKWQSIQTVTALGNPAGSEDIDQVLCADAGGIGPLADSQDNNNPDGKEPPQP